MHKWFKSKHYPDVECVIKIADYFDCSIDYLFGLSSVKSITLTPIPTRFDSRLNQLLLERNLTAFKLSKKIQVSSSTAYRWKQGRIPITENLLSLALYFNVSIDYLIGRSNLR